MQGSSELKNKTKICFVITKGVWGGAQKYLFSLAISLEKDLYDVVVILGNGGILKRKLEEKNIRVLEIETLKRDISIVAEFKSFWRLLKIIWKEKPGVLHLNSPKASGVGAVAGRLCRVPKIIQTVHGFTWNEDRDIFSKILIFFFSWITVLLCHKTIVIAKRERDQALSMPLVNKDKIVLIVNGVSKVEYIDKKIVREALLARIHREDLKIAKDKKAVWIGTISELHKNKGLEYAIGAMAKLRTPFIFFVLGGGEEKENLENLVRQNGLQEQVFLLGFVEDANLYLKAFDIFTLTSVKEGLPYTILEAGMAELPVIASSVGGIPEIIKTSTSGILTASKRPIEITRALEYLIENPTQRTLYGKNLKEKVQKDFSLDQMIKKTINLYK